MKGRTVTKGPETKPPTLNKTRHILPELRKIVAGKWEPTSLDQNRLLDHFTVCTHCQMSVEVFVAATLATLSEHPSNDSTRELLIRLKDALHRIQAQEEQIAGYAEILEMRGIKEAKKRFPVFSEHLKHCDDCKLGVEDMRDTLRQLEHDGMIKPLREDVTA